MDHIQAIPHPNGVTTRGTALIVTQPDLALLQLRVSRSAAHPTDAFKATHDAARTVREFLNKSKIDDTAASRIHLSQEYEGSYSERKPIGYRATIVFNVMLRGAQLDQMEELLAGVIDAGAQEILRIEFSTSRLKELRNEARRMAIAHAREKAEVYCEAAGVALGLVLHIEDRDPEDIEKSLQQIQAQQLGAEIEPEHEDPLSAFNPGNIRVAGSVVVSFALMAKH